MLQLHTPAEAVAWLQSRVRGSLQVDSRAIQPGDGFIAWPGAATDGRKFVRAALAQGLLSVAFSAFWSTLAVMLHAAPFHLGSAAAGAFGLAGAAGALVAPMAGRVADRKGPEVVTRLGAGLVVVAFLAMAIGDGPLWLIAAGAVVFDLGVQASLIAHQTIVYGLEPAARSRLNAVLMGSMFIGMASGAWLGSQALAQWGWQGVCGLAALAGMAALAVRLWPATKI